MMVIVLNILIYHIQTKQKQTGLRPGCFRIGNTGGMLDNILDSKLYRPGCVAYVARSGGMSNELNNMCVCLTYIYIFAIVIVNNNY